MNRRTEILILITILLFSVCIVIFPIFYHQPYKAVTAVDYWSHSTRMQQFDNDGYINFETDWTNLQRIDGESKFYPPGFPILLFSMKEMGNMGYYLPSLVSLFFAPFFCLLLYLISRKFMGAGVGLLAAFMGATFISGSNMLGPTLPLASTLAVLMFLLAFLSLMMFPEHIHKVLLASLFLGTIFITHRASMGALILMFPFIAVLPLAFTRNRSRFLEYFHYPLMMSLFIGLSISMIFWMNLPVEDIMNLGGILPTDIDGLLGISITKNAFLGLIFLMTISVISLFSLPIMGKIMQSSYEPIVKQNLTTMRFFFFISLLPVFLLGLIVWFIIYNGLSFPTTPEGFVKLWGSLSLLANSDHISKVVKQALYAWHLNFVPLLLIIPSIYLYLKSNKKSMFLSISIAVLFTIIFAFIVQDTLFDLKVQRIYFYIAPFVFFLTAWGGHTLLKDKRFNIHVKKIIGISLLLSVVVAAYSSTYVITPMTSDKIGGIQWTNEMIEDNHTIASTGFATQEGRGLGQQDIVIYGGLLTIKNEYDMMRYLIKLDTEYIFVPPEMAHLNDKVLGTDNVYRIYSNGDSNVYLIKR